MGEPVINSNQITAIASLRHIAPAIESNVVIKDNVLKSLLRVTDGLLNAVNENRIKLSTESINSNHTLSRKFYSRSIKISTEGVLESISEVIAYIFKKIAAALGKLFDWISGSGSSSGGSDTDWYAKERKQQEKHKKEQEEAIKKHKEITEKIKEKQAKNEADNKEFNGKKEKLTNEKNQQVQKIIDFITKDHYYIVVSPIISDGAFNPINDDYLKYIKEYNENTIKIIDSIKMFFVSFNEFSKEANLDKIADLCKGDIHHQLSDLIKFNTAIIMHTKAIKNHSWYNADTKINTSHYIEVLDATDEYVLDQNGCVIPKNQNLNMQPVKVMHPVVTRAEAKVKQLGKEIKVLHPTEMWKPNELCNRDAFMKPIEEMSAEVEKGRVAARKQSLSLTAYKSQLESMANTFKALSKEEWTEKRSNALIDVYSTYIQNTGKTIFIFIQLIADHIRTYDAIAHMLKIYYGYCKAVCDADDFTTTSIIGKPNGAAEDGK